MKAGLDILKLMALESDKVGLAAIGHLMESAGEPLQEALHLLDTSDRKARDIEGVSDAVKVLVDFVTANQKQLGDLFGKSVIATSRLYTMAVHGLQLVALIRKRSDWAGKLPDAYGAHKAVAKWIADPKDPDKLAKALSKMLVDKVAQDDSWANRSSAAALFGDKSGEEGSGSSPSRARAKRPTKRRSARSSSGESRQSNHSKRAAPKKKEKRRARSSSAAESHHGRRSRSHKDGKDGKKAKRSKSSSGEERAELDAGTTMPRSDKKRARNSSEEAADRHKEAMPSNVEDATKLTSDKSKRSRSGSSREERSQQPAVNGKKKAHKDHDAAHRQQETESSNSRAIAKEDVPRRNVTVDLDVEELPGTEEAFARADASGH